MGNAFAQLPIVDLRRRLPRRDWIIGRRERTDTITWHWNGPAVAALRQSGEGLIEQLITDSDWQMRPGWGGTKQGAPHLMYHIVIDSAGTIYLCCDLDELLWHCAHADGNAGGIAIHCPVGKYPDGSEQALSDAQRTALIRVTQVLREDYSIPLQRVLGHLEWKHATACPGTGMMAWLNRYRAGVLPDVTATVVQPGLRRFQVKPELTLPVRVRQDYQHRESPIAGRLKPGTFIYVDTINVGADVDGDRRWVHMAHVAHEQADLGFISMTLVREVSA